MLHWLTYVKSAGGVQLLAENGQDYKFIGGSQQISDKMAGALGSRVALDSPVAKIAWHDGSTTVASSHSDGHGTAWLPVGLDLSVLLRILGST